MMFAKNRVDVVQRLCPHIACLLVCPLVITDVDSPWWATLSLQSLCHAIDMNTVTWALYTRHLAAHQTLVSQRKQTKLEWVVCRQM